MKSQKTLQLKYNITYLHHICLTIHYSFFIIFYQNSLKKQKQQEQKKIITKPLSKPEMSYRDVKDDGLSTRTRIDQFSQELNDFKKSFDKLFNGKDLSKYPLSLSVVKETKKCEEAFKKLNDEMKVRHLN